MAVSLAPFKFPEVAKYNFLDVSSGNAEREEKKIQSQSENANDILPSPFSLLTPINELLSGTLWLMTNQLGGQSFSYPSVPKGNANSMGYSWGSMREIHTVPAASNLIVSGAPSNQSSVPFRDPAPSFSRDILITRDFSGTPLQTEPHIAIHPNDPEHLLLGTVDYNFPNVSSYLSIDGGETWEGPSQPQFLRDDVAGGGDPVVGFDRSGNAFIAFISIGVEEFTIGPAVDFASVSSIAVARSLDGGRNWEEAVSSARSGLSRNLYTDMEGKVRGEVILSFLDKPWMAIGPNPNNIKEDTIYITYTEFSLRYGVFHIDEAPFFGVPIQETTIMLVKSSDGGATWSHPTSISPTVRRIFGEGSGSEEKNSVESPENGNDDSTTSRQPLGRKRTVQGSQPAVGIDGTLFVTWLDGTDDETFKGLAEIYISRSDNGGETFSSPIKAAVFNEPGFAPRSTFFRYWASAFPQIVVGDGGEIYIVFTGIPSDKPSDDGDIFLVKSFDRGVSWDLPKRLNDDQTNSLQFFPAITVDPMGIIHAMWGDTRDDNANTKYHIYYTQSKDLGANWGFVDDVSGFRTVNARVTDFHSNPNKGFPGGRFIGDYFSIKATKDDVYMVWADTRLGEFGPINQKIGFTRRQPIKSPEIFVTPAAGPGGQSVTLQGFNFQPDINIFIRVGGVIVATERTNAQGRITSQVFIPISGQGAHSVDIYDDSGNFATASFFMEFGFDDIQKTQSSIEQKFDVIDRKIGELNQAMLGKIERQGDTATDTKPFLAQFLPTWLILGLFAMASFAIGVSITLGVPMLWRKFIKRSPPKPWQSS